MITAGINCGAKNTKAANYFLPGARTVLDAGAEEGMAAKIDKNGDPIDFAINEKCAAGETQICGCGYLPGQPKD